MFTVQLVKDSVIQTETKATECTNLENLDYLRTRSSEQFVVPISNVSEEYLQTLTSLYTTTIFTFYILLTFLHTWDNGLQLTVVFHTSLYLYESSTK